MAKQIAWDYVKLYTRQIPKMKYNEAELRADFPNGARIQLFGADNPDQLRGIYSDGVVLDEYGIMSPRVYEEVLTPALTDRKGYTVFIGTPAGYNHFHAKWMDAQEDQEHWFSAMYKASETKLIDKEVLEQAKREMTEEAYEQEFECSFEGVMFGSYFGKLIDDAEKDGRVTAVPHEPALPVHIAVDIGVDDETAIWFLQVQRGGAIRAVNYLEGQGEGAEFYLKQLEKKNYHYGTDYVPHDFKARAWAAGGRSPHDIFKAAGRKMHVVAKMSPLDRIQATRSILPMVWFDKVKCRKGLDALRQYHREFDEKRNTFKPTPVHDWSSHATDAFGCFAFGFTDTSNHPRVRIGPRVDLRSISTGWMGR